MNTRLLKRSAIIIGGIAVGVALTYPIVHEIQLKTGRDQLRGYALRLIHKSALITAEKEQTVTTVSHDNLPFCSDQELAFLRSYVFKSDHIKDIGRINEQDGKLYCTTGLGRLAIPQPRMIPDFTVGATNIGLRVPLLISNESTGLVLIKSGVSIVMNPDAHNSDEPPRSYSWYFFDAIHSRIVLASGHTIPLSSAEVIAGKFIQRDKIFYQPVCSQTAESCVVAAEPLKDVLANHKRLFAGYVFGGALLGGACALILILLFERQRSMEVQLRRAIRRDALTLVYQPVVDLETCAIVGVEALVRWKNEAGEMVRPDIFVALAEEKEFCNKITQLVLRKSLAELHDLLAAGDIGLTLNITLEDLNNADFFSLLEQSIRSADIKPSLVGLELTERFTVDDATTSRAISELKRAGHKIYIDDFGSGYSSLAYLHRLEVDAIKIDRGFTQTIGRQSATTSVVPQILAMATELNLMVVVEGIETCEQAEYFRKAGTGILGQGLFFSEPVPAAMLKSLIREGALSKPIAI